jgi:hypothetical protein
MESSIPTGVDISSHSGTNPTSIPVQAVDADQLPRDKGLTYEEVTSILGSLYLDSHHQMMVREEQFSAVVDNYKESLAQLEAQAQTLKTLLEDAQKELSVLRRELETRNEHRPTTASGDDRDN